MRIIETVYKVKGMNTAYDVKMTQVKGLKIRELVRVRAVNKGREEVEKR